ncbi:MAG: PilZ domain-containing protein [Candidatus Omnitrophica bacterium]|nr:PilZ domain-containing protein [Candidatus Omnitrophota bacterium]MDD5552556.1 PilZ domain-containing protein [Candidatus Omnitrophota bacterium]
MDDRRVFERIGTKLPVRFLDPISGKEGTADTTDISANGLGMVTNESLRTMTPLEMWLGIPDKHEPLYTRGQVVWSESLPSSGEYRIGIRLEKAELMGLARVLWLKRRAG